MPLGISKLKAVFTFPSPIAEPQLGSQYFAGIKSLFTDSYQIQCLIVHLT
jgi:hypothetical protein